MSTFGERLDQAIGDSGYSYVDFSEQIGMDEDTVNDIIKGCFGVVNTDLAIILRALPHTDARWLICGDNNEN